MSTQDPIRERPGFKNGDAAASHRAMDAPTRQRRTTETKAAFKTTEFIAFLAAAAGLLIAGAVVDQNDAGGLGARQVWLYLTILAVGYMISRGLAKSGSSDPYRDDDDARRHDGR